MLPRSPEQITQSGLTDLSARACLSLDTEYVHPMFNKHSGHIFQGREETI